MHSVVKTTTEQTNKQTNKNKKQCDNLKKREEEDNKKQTNKQTNKKGEEEEGPGNYLRAGCCSSNLKQSLSLICQPTSEDMKLCFRTLFFSLGAVRKSRWPSWAFRPNEPYGFCGRKARS